VLVERGSLTPEKRRDRARLSVRDPMVENLVGNLNFDGDCPSSEHSAQLAA
jgi:hypothetical protein